ncbi:porphobilinogen synthase [Methanobrevibacter sp. DSM 116169]|uniref:porphobilinogen synthase n=1 Tax=Methanobrevibacter sp. DSM 116169 TaxID=3242727 RepID=UPI0038FC04BD
MFPTTRLRRLRKNSKIREIVKETKLNKEDLIYPIFFKEDLKEDREEIMSMPDEYRYSLDAGVEFAKKLESKGLKSIIVFGIPSSSLKDEIASPSRLKDGIVQKAIKKLKEETNLVVISDVCLCQYTSHGHCGIINENTEYDDNIEVLNDESLDYLAQMALSHAEAGVDIVAPSDMMDGRVGVIRDVLDDNNFKDVSIMSYSVKYASAFYEPFRDAACSSPGDGNRKSYQMDPANTKEALRECEADIIEGADFLMVKPALAFLDIIKLVDYNFNLPLVAYNVSGEYSMIMAAIASGYLTEDAIFESLLSIKRAGADLIITNFASKIIDKI